MIPFSKVLFFCDRDGFGSPADDVVEMVGMLSADLASLPSWSPVELVVAVTLPALLLLSRGLARHFPLLVAADGFRGFGREISLERGVVDDFPRSRL